MEQKTYRKSKERGAVLVLFVIFVVVIIACLAFAVDVNHLILVRNELQNAADAGALAGAGTLYVDPDGAGPKKAGEEVNFGANQIAYDTAILNKSDQVAVEVDWTSDGNSENNGDILRGHWSFANNEFTPDPDPNGTRYPVDLWMVSEEDLDLMDGSSYTAPNGSTPFFVNAVKVTTRREDQPAISFFAKFFGVDSFIMEASAVAYIGFAGSLGPLEASQPIVICDDTLRNSAGEYECNIGRMSDSGASCQPNDPDCSTSINTAGWSTLEVKQPGDTCSASSASNIKDLIVGQGNVCLHAANPNDIFKNDLLQATNGVQAASYSSMRDCWWSASNNGTQPYEMTLPVVDCGPGRQVDNCVVVVGAVTVNMLYMAHTGAYSEDAAAMQLYSDIPTSMTNDDPTGDKVFSDWSYASNCNDAANGRDFTSLIGETTYNALTMLRDFPVRNEAGGYSVPTDDLWLADPPNSSDQRWQGIETYNEQMARWDCLVDYYNLVNTNGTFAPLNKKSMYFLPDCEPQEPEGITGGENFGVLSEYPVLVE
jgi:hypothetical protein